MIGIKEIKAQLSEWTYNLGELCRSNKINKYSFHKPINSPKLTQLSDSDYYAADDGFNLWNFNNPFDMLHELQSNNSTLWTYNARLEPYRLSDFWDYNHYAQTLFEFTFVGNNAGTFGDVLRLQTSTDIQSVVNNWHTPAQLSSTGDLILLVFERGKQYDASSMGTVGIYKVCQFMNYDGDDIRFKIPSSSAIQTGEYTIFPCISTATYRLNDQEYYVYNSNNEIWPGLWFAFPKHAQMNFTITQTSPAHSDYFAYFDFNEFEGVDFLYTPNNYELTDITFTNYIVYSPPSRTKTFDVTIEYYYYNVSNPAGYVLLGQAFRHFTFDNVLETVPINYRNTIAVVNDARLTEDIISITQKVYISSGGEQQIKEFSRTLEKNN